MDMNETFEISYWSVLEAQKLILIEEVLMVSFKVTLRLPKL